MKKILVLTVLILVALVSVSSAQTVTCSSSGSTPFQNQQYAKMLAQINAERVANGLTPYANFPAHCAGTMLDAFNSWVNQQNSIDGDKVKAAAIASGPDTAPTGQCTAVGLGAGCTKVAVACMVLRGNQACD